MKNRKPSSFKSTLYSVFSIFALLLSSLDHIFIGNIYVVISTALSLPYFLQQVNSGRFKGSHSTIMWFLFLVLVGGLLNMINTVYGVGGLIQTVGMVSLAVFCIDNPKICLYLSLFFCINTFLYLYQGIFVAGININELFEDMGMSKNYPGFLIVAYTSLYALCKYRVYRTLPLLIPLLGVYFTFFLDGRASFGIMIMFAAFCMSKHSSNKYVNIGIFLVSLSLIIANIDFLEYWFGTTRLSESRESSRTRIWAAYFRYMDLPRFIFGCDTINMPVLRDFRGNPHNAFLNFHGRTGIIGFVTLCVVVKNSIKGYWLQNNKTIIIIMALLMGRLFFDSQLICSHDYIFYTFLFLPLLNVKTGNKQELSKRSSIAEGVLNII